MKIRHVGLVCSSQEKADKFYAHLLGLKKSEPKVVEKQLAQALFNLSSEINYLSYFNDSIEFEIFIMEEGERPSSVSHVCLEVSQMEEFLTACLDVGVAVKKLRKGEKQIVFISDFDGHLFEIKEPSSGN